jgi:hypothetical protein
MGKKVIHVLSDCPIGQSAGWRWPIGQSDNTWITFFPIGNELLPHLAAGMRFWMEAVALEEFRLVHGRLPEINEAVGELQGFDPESPCSPEIHSPKGHMGG